MLRVVAAFAILGVLLVMLIRSDWSSGDAVSVSGDRPDTALRDEPGTEPELAAELTAVREEAAETPVPTELETAPVDSPAPGCFFGKVVAGESGDPIRGARLLPGPNFWYGDAEPVAVSDAAGDFELPLRPHLDQTMTVMAEGRGPGLLFVDGEHGSQESRSVIALQQGAVLSGRILDRPGSHRALKVRLQTDGYRLFRRPRFGEADPTWVSAVESDGSFRIEGLPPNVPLWATAHSGREQVLRLPTEVVLAPAEHREVVWRLGTGASVSGLALRASDGQPEQDLEIWLAPFSVTGGSYFESHERGVQKTRSDWEGRFSFEGLAVGEWAVGPAPEGLSFDEQAGSNAAAPMPTRFEIGALMSMVEVVLAVHRGLFITGRVLDPAGQPASDVDVDAHGPEGGGWSDGRSGKDGVFRVGPLVPSLYSLGAGLGSDKYASSDRVQARSGETGVVLRLKRGAGISVQVIDALTGQGTLSSIALQGVEPRGYMAGSTDQEGRLDFNAVEPGRHHLIGQTDDGRIGLLKDIIIQAGSSVEDLKLMVWAGGQVTVCYDGPHKWAHYSAIFDGVTIALDGLQNGAEASFPAPAGALAIELTAFDRTSGILPPPILFERSEKVHVQVGETTRVVFQVDE